MKFINTKKLFEENRGKGTFHYVLDLSGWGDEEEYTYQGEADEKDLKIRDWEWEECDDDESFEYFEVVFIPEGEDIEKELEKLNEEED